MKSMVRFIAGVLLVVASSRVWAEEQIAWTPDFRTACGMAAEQRRLVLLHFFNDNCPPCVRLEKNVFTKNEVAEAVAQNYLPVKVHVGKNPQLASRYRINQWPTDVVVTPSGLEVFRSVSPQAPSDYIAMLDKVATQAGIGAGRQWKSSLPQVAKTAGAEATTMTSAAAASAQATVQQTSNEVQQAFAKTQQKWDSSLQRFQAASDEARNTVQQTVDKTAETVANTAQAANQQVTATVEKTQQQITNTATEAQAQFQAAKQEWQASTQQATQQFDAVARDMRSQWQANTQSLLDRRSAFVPAETSPAAASAATTLPNAAAVSPNPPAASPAPEASASLPAATQPALATTPTPAAPTLPALPTENPWVANREMSKPTASYAPPGAAVESSAAAQGPPAAAAAVSGAVTAPAAETPPIGPNFAPNAPVANRSLVPASQAPPVALDGFCPVNLLETVAHDPNDRSAWKKGDKRFGAIHRGRTYLFTSAENQQKFLANPDNYAPVLSGCDPVRFAERGEMIDGKRAYGLVTPDKRIFLFADEASRNRFEQAPASYSTAVQQAMLRSEGGNLYR